MATYTLIQNGASLAVESLGAELFSYTAAGKEYIWQGDPSIWHGHGPVLFPIVGSLKDETIKIEGQSYHMRKHGFLRRMEFALEKKTEDSLQFTTHATPETRAMYPFDFTARITYTVEENGFSATFRIQNDSGRTMPMCIGGHPGFICPLKEGEAFTDYVLKFPNPEQGRNMLCPNGYIITGEETLKEFHIDTLPLKYEYFSEKDALILAGLKSRSVRLLHKTTGRGIEFSFPGFDVLGVWSAPGKYAKYVCLEPWCGLPAFEDETGNFEDKPYVKFIGPGRDLEVSYSMRIL